MLAVGMLGVRFACVRDGVFSLSLSLSLRQLHFDTESFLKRVYVYLGAHGEGGLSNLLITFLLLYLPLEDGLLAKLLRQG